MSRRRSRRAKKQRRKRKAKRRGPPAAPPPPPPAPPPPPSARPATPSGSSPEPTDPSPGGGRASKRPAWRSSPTARPTPRPRVRGLVRMMNQIRTRLDEGVPLDQRSALKIRIARNLATVEEICAAHGGTPDDLPTPSRRAYHFLANIDVDALPDPGAEHRSVQQMDFPGVVGETEWLRDEMADLAAAEAGAPPWSYTDAEGLPPPSLSKVRRSLDRQAEIAQRDLAAPDRGAESLQAPTRRALRWICWLAESGRLERQLETLTRACRIVLTHPQPTWEGRHVRLVLYDIAPLVRGHRGSAPKPWCEVTANQGFVDAPDDVLLALLRRGSGVPDASPTLVRDYALGPAYQRVRDELRAVLPRVAWAEESSPAGGHFHDLDAAFTRVNATYFGNRMPHPALRWSHSPSGRKLGHYNFARDEVVLSVALDAPEVPVMVIDFVVYHELLHKQHGLRRSGTRRIAHTAEFRRDERRFAQYAAVHAWLRQESRTGVD